MTTPPKSLCHSCYGTGIDPIIGFLDCELCSPAFAGVPLSAPEQPEPKCETCNDHGEIGCLRPDGYDGERCPDCNPAVVKRYHVTEAGLVEGQALGRINVVLGPDYDSAVQCFLTAAEGCVAAERRERALQALLTAADERNDSRDSEIFAQVQSALRRSFSLGQIYWQQADSDSTCQQNKSDQTMETQEQHILNVLKSVGAALKTSDITAQQNRCESCNGSGTKADAETGIDSGCAVCGGSGDAPAEGVGDDTTLEEDREDFKKVFVRINTKQGQSISLADMIARYEKKP